MAYFFQNVNKSINFSLTIIFHWITFFNLKKIFYVIYNNYIFFVFFSNINLDKYIFTILEQLLNENITIKNVLFFSR